MQGYLISNFAERVDACSIDFRSKQIQASALPLASPKTMAFLSHHLLNHFHPSTPSAFPNPWNIGASRLPLSSNPLKQYHAVHLSGSRVSEVARDHKSGLILTKIFSPSRSSLGHHLLSPPIQSTPNHIAPLPPHSSVCTRSQTSHHPPLPQHVTVYLIYPILQARSPCTRSFPSYAAHSPPQAFACTSTFSYENHWCT